jgi:heat shock protein HspQ
MIAPLNPPSFQPGQLVRHVRYDYRGVVVDFDPYCKAPDEWYYRNRTQPDRNQPWYHVLVHGSEAITYAAQTNLEADDSPAPVEHPLVQVFFSEFTGQEYVRNDRQWPGGWPEK